MAERTGPLEDLVATETSWRGRRVLVTGHTGFKGAWLSLWLQRLGAQVFGFALPPDTTPSLFALASIETQVASTFGDVRDAAAVERVMQTAQPEVVLHLAAQALVRRSYDDPVGTYATNVMGTIHVLEAARRVPDLKAVVVVTSDKCYENREWPWPYREQDPMGGYDPYSSSKGCAELVTAAWRRSFFDARHRTHAVGVASARAGNVIGGGDWAVDRLVPDAMRAFADGQPVVIRSPRAVRPWQHVLEPLSGYLRLAECLLADPVAFAEPWNFGPSVDDAMDVQWVIDRLARTWGEGARWELDRAAHPHEAGLLQVDGSKARGRLGWRPRLPLAPALAWTVEWYRRVAEGEDARAVCLEQLARYAALGEEASA